jgi:hypothetical protein
MAPLAAAPTARGLGVLNLGRSEGTSFPHAVRLCTIRSVTTATCMTPSRLGTMLRLSHRHLSG